MPVPGHGLSPYLGAGLVALGVASIGVGALGYRRYCARLHPSDLPSERQQREVVAKRAGVRRRQARSECELWWSPPPWRPATRSREGAQPARGRLRCAAVKPRIGISLGDPSGIGAEVTLAALRTARVRRALEPVLFGDASLARVAPSLRAVSQLKAKDRAPGRPTRLGGLAQHAYVTAAVAAAQAGEVHGLCTAPVSKEAITRAGIPFMGHTELLAAAFGVEVLMLMRGPRLSVALATNHLPLAKVPRALSTSKLVAQLELLSRELTPLIGRRPRIAVCGLNPHAGEGGVLGTEEVRVIGPAIARARRRGLDVHGPLAADGLFARAPSGFPFDVALAMFHDQGLVAAKTLDFARTVNVTLGLPVPRTSPDHGVAYDLAGQGRADPSPMVHALLMAAEFAAARQRST